jgi:general secretion pathway protein A
VETSLVLNPCVTGDQLLRAILKDFGLTVRGNDRLDYIEQLNESLLMQAERGHNVVIVIDESQDLDADVMEQVRLLSNLETDEQKLMQIVLAGQPELRERLAQHDLRQLRQRILIRCHLSPLQEDEVTDYVAYRLHIAGAGEDVWFDADALRIIYQFSNGIPRLINAICDLSMLAGYASQMRTICPDHAERALQQLECKV